MRGKIIWFLVLFGVGAAFSLQTPSAFAGGKVERLGRLTVDKHEATVDFQDCQQDQQITRITISIRKPRLAGAIAADRFDVWLLRKVGGPRVALCVQQPPKGALAEEGEGEHVTAKAVFCFDYTASRSWLAAVVVTVDGEPKVFKVARESSVDYKVIAAWKKAGATFYDAEEEVTDPESQVPVFWVDQLQLPLAQELPLPAVPFRLALNPRPNGNWGPGSLAKLPGRTKARGLRLQGVLLNDADRKELASLKQLQMVSLTGDRIGDAELKALAGLPQLQSLTLMGTQISDAGLKELAGLQRLHTLRLDDCRNLSDRGWKVLVSLQQLRTLGLSGTRIGDVGLKELAKLKELQTLDLRATEIRIAGLKELIPLKQLRVLKLDHLKIGGPGLKELAGLQRLHTLSLDYTELNDADIQELAHLRQLRVLSLESNQVIGDEGLRGLAGLNGLQSLNLNSTRITDVGLKELAGLQELRTLNLASIPLSDAGMKHLAGLKELRLLNLEGSHISDVGLKELASLKKLQRLMVGDFGTKLTSADIAELRKALPWTCIAP